MISNYVALGIRFVAILFFFKAIRDFIASLQHLQSGSPYGADVSVWPVAATALIAWVFAFAFWFGAKKLGKWITSGGLDVEAQSIPPISLLAVFVAAIGLFLFSYGMVDALYYLSMTLLGTELNMQGLPKEVKSNIIATSFEVMAGAFIVLKARTVAAKINEVSS